MNFVQAFLENPFLQMALWAALLSSISSGIIGSYVVVRRITFIAGSVAHSVLGGLGFCLWLQQVYGIWWANPLIGAIGAAVASAFLLGYVHIHFKQREDALIAAIWSTGMAIGVIFISLTPGSTSELMNYLFGNILWISQNDLYALIILNILILSLVIWKYRSLLTLCFDEEQAILQNISTKKLYFTLLSLIAITTVLLIQIIGTILVLALLTIPPTIASLFAKRLKTMMIFSCILAACINLLGLSFSYELNWPPGATISLLAAITYLLTLQLKEKILKTFIKIHKKIKALTNSGRSDIISG